MLLTAIKMKEIQDQLISFKKGLDREDPEIVEQYNNIVQAMIKRGQMAYMFDILIWKFIQVKNAILENENSKEDYYTKKKQHQKYITQNMAALERFKSYQIIIYNIEQIIYDQSDVVDRDQLYIIDPEYEDIVQHRSIEMDTNTSEKVAKSRSHSPEKKGRDKSKSPNKSLKSSPSKRVSKKEQKDLELHRLKSS